MFQLTENYRGPIPFSWYIENEQKIDLCPENYQRCFVWKEEQQRELLRTLFDPNPGYIPEVHLRHHSIPKDTSRRKGIIAELIDGQQRMTSLFRFAKNEIKTPKELKFICESGIELDISEKTINELPQEAHLFFRSYTIQTAVYSDITNRDAAEIFSNKLNAGTPLTFAEKRNAYSTAISSFVRNTARLGLTKSGIHPLFETKIGEDGDIEFKYFHPKEFIYKKYSADVLTATICNYITSKNGFNSIATNSDLDNMYCNKLYEEKFQSDKRVITILDGLKEIITSSNGQKYKRNWNLVILKLIVRIWNELDIQKYKIEYPEKFVTSFITLYNELIIPSEEEKLNKLKKSVFHAHVNRPKSTEIVGYTTSVFIDAILKNMDSFGVSIKNASPRFFSKEDITRKHIEQNGICPICNEEILIDDAQGGHKVSYKDGGTVDYSNLVVLHGKCNRLQGTDEFK